MKHSLKLGSSSGMIRRSITSRPCSLASAITVWRVMPLRKQSAIGVWMAPSRVKKMLAPVHSATRPCQSSIMASA